MFKVQRLKFNVQSLIAQSLKKLAVAGSGGWR